jgi:biopolymer transport protein ExbD
MNFQKGLRLRRSTAAIDITPLVDVVFILLIFLLVSTTFKSQEHAFSIVLPVGDQQTRVTQVTRPTVFVTREGNYVLYTPTKGSDAPVTGSRMLSLGELSQALRDLAATGGKETAVNIKGDAKADYQQILDVVNECQRHGLQRVYFPYKKGERKP